MLFSLFKFQFTTRDTEEKTLEELVMEIQIHQMDELRNHLLQKYRSFISKSVSRVCQRYIDPSVDDEFSVGLEAFNEAISQYSPEKGKSFLTFADMVIKRRVIDYIRKECKYDQSISLFHQEGEEGEEYRPYEIRAAILQYQMDSDTVKRKEEIFLLQEKLKDYGVSFMDLVDEAPRHVDARQNAFSIAKLLVEDHSLKQTFLHKKRLPLKELTKKVELSRKTIERNRKYITALALIQIGDFPYLRSYLTGLERS
ncbi:RNA polymerase sigma-I factor [Microaerobacter geothermalis]|uniref:RNA polymerase sigma-I factor n=1 Tax=Microaerobacter geothermalis TaxID=674972 RepID=UPI001F208940|nr:RNA polymerase sigma-I factor [Microaerobacter geothermalis]MCF6092373.1 RNA polymerase sigma-I factor [Microaerobacter geothermalis]